MSSNIGGWENSFLVDVQIIGSAFEVKSSSLAVPSEDPSPTFASFLLGVLGELLVVHFLGCIFPAEEKK
jgi:hypothetical protein